MNVPGSGLTVTCAAFDMPLHHFCALVISWKGTQEFCVRSKLLDEHFEIQGAKRGYNMAGKVFRSVRIVRAMTNSCCAHCCCNASNIQ